MATPAATRNPTPSYDENPANSAALYGDKALYGKIGGLAEDEEQRSLVEGFEIPIRSGRAWVVKKGMFVCMYVSKVGVGEGSIIITHSTHYTHLIILNQLFPYRDYYCDEVKSISNFCCFGFFTQGNFVPSAHRMALKSGI